MDLPRHPETLDRIAAAYALGTLRGGARRRFESIARRSPAARAAALLWQERLVGLTELQPGAQPSPNVWKRIENLLDRPAPARATAAAPRRATLWRALGLVGSVAAVASIALAVNFNGELAQRNAQLVAQLQAQPEVRYVAVLADERGPSLLATFDPKHNQLTLKRVGNFQEAPDKSLQLWALPAGGAPRSLGVVPADPVARLVALEAQLQQSPAMAVSLEPKGGVPSETGPTGPVLFKGAVLQTAL